MCRPGSVRLDRSDLTVQTGHVAEEFSVECRAWRDAPGRSAAACVVGMVVCWIVAVTVLPAALGAGLCVPRRVRYCAGAMVPGLVIGRVLGWTPMLAAIGIATLA